MILDDPDPSSLESRAHEGTIPESWLAEPVGIRQVEADLADEWMPDYWLDQWRALVRRMQSDDELWFYLGQECGPEGESGEWQEGYAVVRDGAIIDFIGCDRW
jgi:hypothetical protein